MSNLTVNLSTNLSVSPISNKNREAGPDAETKNTREKIDQLANRQDAIYSGKPKPDQKAFDKGDNFWADHSNMNSLYNLKRTLETEAQA